MSFGGGSSGGGQTTTQSVQPYSAAQPALNQIISEAKTKAKEETDKILTSAREVIKTEKLAAITELKNQVAVLSLEIAEKIVKDQLSSDDKQKALVDSMIKDVNLN